MKKIIYLFALLFISENALSQCPLIHTKSDSVVACKLRVRNLTPGLLKLNSNGNASIATSGTDYGTVSSVSVTSANGVSGSVATSTSTPAITLSLGAITPSSVNGVTISGSSTPTLSVTGTTTVSGPNTGDQTITLTGDVTGSGTGSFATAIGLLKVTNGMLAGSISSAKLVGVDITTLGTITTGTWHGDVIGDSYVNSSLTGKTYNGLTLASATTGFTIAGGTTSKTLTVPLDATVSGTNTGDQTISDATITTTDITTNNFTTSKHGFVPKGTNVGNYLKDDGTWSSLTSSQWTTTGSDIYYNTGKVMVGNASAPSAKLHIVETGTSNLRGALFDQYSSSANGSILDLRKARGTYASPSTIVTSDTLARFRFWGHDGTNFIHSAGIRAISTGTIATNRVPSTLEFMTSTDASPSVLTRSLILDQTQKATFANTVEATSLSLLDATYKVGLDVSATNTLRISSGFSNLLIAPPTIIFSGTISPNVTSTSLILQTTGGTATNGGTIITRNANITLTSGIANGLSVTSPFAPTTGSAIYNGLLINPIVNQTGGTGETNLIKLNLSTQPNVTTSLYGLRAQLSASPTGGGAAYNIYADGTAPNLFSGAISYTQTTKAQITSNQNDYSIGTGSSFRISTDASRNITGITGGSDGKLLIIRNVGSFNTVFTNEDAGSTAANRITCSTGANLTVAPNGVLMLQYDATTSRWFDISLR